MNTSPSHSQDRLWAAKPTARARGQTPRECRARAERQEGGDCEEAKEGAGVQGRQGRLLAEQRYLSITVKNPGEGNGNPPQCSCLENPRDGRAWWAAVYRVAQSRTRLKRLSSSSSSQEPKAGKEEISAPLIRNPEISDVSSALAIPILPPQAVYPKGNQSWIFVGRTDTEAETLIHWPPDAKYWLIGKDPDAGKDWRQEEKGTTEDEIVEWHHRLDGHGFG